MPRKPTKPRTTAENTAAPRATRRKVSAKQARDRGDLARHGRVEHQAVKPMKFPGKLGGR